MAYLEEKEEDIWHIKLPDGSTRKGTLDQLDDAYQAGHINAKTLLRAEGTDEWVTLGSLLGLDEPAPAPQAIPSMPSSIAPTIADLDIDENALRPSSKRWVIAAIAAALVIGGVAAAFAKFGGATMPDATKAAAASPVVPNVAANVKEAVPDEQGRTLSEEQRKQLLEADKQRDAQHRARVQQQQQNAPSKPYKSSDPFHKTNDKYDPLNTGL